MSPRARKAVLLQLPAPSFRWPHLEPNLPLGPGYLASWARGRAPGWEVEILPWHQADILGDEALLAEIHARGPALVGLSAYAWNAERSLHLASRLREDGTPTVIGGPEVHPDTAWLLEGFAGGTLVQGEGEEAFSRLLSAHPRLPSGLFSAPPPDLSTLESPYLTGILPPHPDGSVWLETLRGCPYRCAYCTYGKLQRRPRTFPAHWLEAHLSWARARGAEEVYLMDPSFNVRREWDATLGILERSNPDRALAFHTELVAEALRPGDGERLARAGLRSCEVGLQSIHRSVLDTVGRPWHRERWLRGVEELLAAQVSVAVGLIAGLPGDTLEGFAQSLDFVRTHAPAAEVQVFPLSLLPGSRLRERRRELGLEALPRPPYTVFRTPGYPPEDLERVFDLFEEATGLEVDPVDTPGFAGPWTGGEGAPYLSGLRLELARETGVESGWVERVAPRAAHHFLLWIRGWSERLPEQLRRFRDRLPHTVLTVALDDGVGWDPARLEALLAAGGTGRHYLDRSARLLYGAGARLVPRLAVLVPAAPRPAPAWEARVRALADLVWTVKASGDWAAEATRLARQGETVLVEGEPPDRDLPPLARALGQDAAGVCFGSRGAQEAWDRARGLGALRARDHRLTLP